MATSRHPADAAIGKVRYGRIDGTVTAAVLVSRRRDAGTGKDVYLFAVPGLATDPRTRSCRADGCEPHSERDLQVLLKPMPNMSGMKTREPHGCVGWPDGRVPLLSDLEAIAEDVTALPKAAVELSMVMSTPSPRQSDQQTPHAQHGSGERHGGGRLTFAQEATAVSEPPPSGDVSGVLAALLEGQHAMMARLDAVEAGAARRESAGTFQQGTGQGGFSPSEEALLREMANRAPRGASALVPPGMREREHCAPLAQSASASMFGARPLQPGFGAFQEQPAHAFAPQARGPGPAGTAADCASWQQFQEPQLQPRAPPGVHEFGYSASATSPKGLLWRMEGVRGRVAQNQLDQEFDTSPAEVMKSFEEAVVRRSGGSTAESADTPHRMLLSVFRDTVPAKDHALSARLGEIMIDAYRHLREGRTAHAGARLALGIGAVEQAVLDGGKWQFRAQHMAGLPECPLHRYRPLGSDAPAQGKLGATAHLADPVRATTARAIFQESG